MNKTIISASIYIILAMLSSSCGFATNQPSQNSSLPTEEKPMVLATQSPTATISSPTEGVEPTQEPEPTLEPAIITQSEVIDIFTPQPGDIITSPLTLTGLADPTFEQTLILSLLSMDGLELLNSPITIKADIGQRGPFSAQLDYSAQDVVDGLLQVYSRSARDGSLIHLNSIIIQFGDVNDTTQQVDPSLEKIVLDMVRVGQANGKLELQVDGTASGIFENNLQFKLCGDGDIGSQDFICGTAGNVMITGDALVEASDPALPGRFSIRAPIPDGRWKTGSVVVYSSSPASGQIDHAASQIIRNGP